MHLLTCHVRPILSRSLCASTLFSLIVMQLFFSSHVFTTRKNPKSNSQIATYSSQHRKLTAWCVVEKFNNWPFEYVNHQKFHKLRTLLERFKKHANRYCRPPHTHIFVEDARTQTGALGAWVGHRREKATCAAGGDWRRGARLVVCRDERRAVS